MPDRLFGERRNCGCLVVLHVEDGVEFRDLQQIVNLLGQVQQLQLAPAVLHRSEGADQLANSRAVDIADVSKVQQYFVRTFSQYITNGVANRNAAFAESDAAAKIQNGDAVDLAILYFHAHVLSSP